MSAAPTPRQVGALSDALAHDGPCGLCGRQATTRDLGALAARVAAPESRAALGLADGQGATLVLAVCRRCYGPAERNPGEVVKAIAARLAAERSAAGATLPRKGREMTGAALNRRKNIPTGVEAFVHHDVEIRTAGGGAYRGELTAVDASFFYLVRANGRGILLPRAAVVAIADEQRLAPAANGDREGVAE